MPSGHIGRSYVEQFKVLTVGKAQNSWETPQKHRWLGSTAYRRSRRTSRKTVLTDTESHPTLRWRKRNGFLAGREKDLVFPLNSGKNDWEIIRGSPDKMPKKSGCLRLLVLSLLSPRNLLNNQQLREQNHGTLGVNAAQLGANRSYIWVVWEFSVKEMAGFSTFLVDGAANSR